MDFLSDKWAVNGDDLASLEETLTYLDNHTAIAPMHLRNFEVISLNERKGFTSAPGKIGVLVFKEDNLESAPAVGAFAMADLEKRGVPDVVVNEFVNSSKTILKYNKKIYFLADFLSRDLGARAGLGGEEFCIPSEHRSRYICSRYVEDDEDCNVMVRHENGIPKIVAMGSVKFAHVPQAMLIELIHNFETDMGPANCIGWHVDHQFTSVLVTYPEKGDDIAKIYGLKHIPVPGMLLETSDTGDCSLKCTAVWVQPKSNPTFVRADSYSRKHSLSMCRKDKKTLSDIVAEEASATVFKTYRELPDRLCILSTVDVKNPEYVIEKVLVDVKAKKLLGQRRAADLENALKGIINPAEKYSGYDIAMLFLDEMINNTSFDEDSTMLREKLEEMAYNAVFAKIEKYADFASGSTTVVAM